MKRETLTTSEAAARLGVSTNRIRAMIVAGRLPAEKFGPVYVINENDLSLVKNRKPGRPRMIKAETKQVKKRSKKSTQDSGGRSGRI